MITKNLFIKLSFIILIIITVYFGYSVFFRNNLDRVLSQKEMDKNLVRLETAFSQVPNLNLEDIKNGFWYLYKDEKNNESVVFLDSKELVKSNFTNKYLEKLKKEVENSEIHKKEYFYVVKKEEMSDEYQFHNKLYSSKIVGDFLEIKSELENKKNISKEELSYLSYLYELEGNYEKRDNINNLICSLYNIRCENLIIEVKGQVLDIENNYLQNATVEVISKSNYLKTKTDAYGYYSFILNVNELEKIRIKAGKRNFSDGVASLLILNENKKIYFINDLILSSVIDIFTVDTQNKTITGQQNYIEENSFVVKSPQSIYKVPFESLVYKDGSRFNGVVDVYLYEFTRDTVPDSLIEVDTFDQIMGYAGDLMKTFGMPYIQFFDTETDEELYVFSSSPMTITHQIYHMDLLYKNVDELYGPLTEDDMIFLVDKTEELGGYPIDRQFLINNELLKFPAWWCFDQDRGIWDNIGIKVLDKNGLIEAQFYTIKK